MGGRGWADEKLVLTELEGRFRDACFCCARWNDVASERSLSPPCEGGAGGVMREPWKSKTILLASREGCERTERERAWEDLVNGHAGTTPPTPLRKGGKRAQRNRDESAACARPTFHQLSLGLPIFWHPGNVVGLFSSLATVLPPLITTTRCRPPKLGLFACPIPPWFVLSCNLQTTNDRAIWLCFGAFLSPPAPCLRLHRPQATIPPLHAPRSTLHARPAPPSAGTSGVRSCGDSSRWLLPDNNRRFATDRTQGRFILAF
jgi:hypothetical protein